MAQRHGELAAAGTRIAGISVDPVEANAAMVEKLRLPFPLLSDPDGEEAIQPYGVWNPDERGGIARPAVVLVDPHGEESFRQVGQDFADRATEDDLLEAVNAMALPATTQPEPETGPAEPGEKAMTLEALVPYFKGARLAAYALGRRHREIADDTKAYVAAMDRYLEAIQRVRRAG